MTETNRIAELAGRAAYNTIPTKDTVIFARAFARQLGLDAGEVERFVYRFERGMNYQRLGVRDE
jgi:hypothetical protein